MSFLEIVIVIVLLLDVLSRFSQMGVNTKVYNELAKVGYTMQIALHQQNDVKKQLFDKATDQAFDKLGEFLYSGFWKFLKWSGDKMLKENTTND